MRCSVLCRRRAALPSAAIVLQCRRLQLATAALPCSIHNTPAYCTPCEKPARRKTCFLLRYCRLAAATTKLLHRNRSLMACTLDLTVPVDARGSNLSVQHNTVAWLYVSNKPFSLRLDAAVESVTFCCRQEARSRYREAQLIC
jgi:hypothetical protein